MAQTKISLLFIVLAAVVIAPIKVVALPLPVTSEGTGSSHPQAPAPAQGHPTVASSSHPNPHANL